MQTGRRPEAVPAVVPEAQRVGRLRLAALVKQIPAFEEMELGPDGRLRREGLELEMNPYCRRAVGKAVELAAEHGGSVTVLTLGPPAAEDVLREAVAWGTSRGVSVQGVLVSDRMFAGSDTLATARALDAAIRREGPFDLILVGRNSVDADTGQVGPELAEQLDLPFLGGVRHLDLVGGVVRATCEHDDGWIEAEVRLPAVLSAAERLCQPCKAGPEERERVPASRIRWLDAAALGGGPWGQEGSPTRVGPVRLQSVERLQHLEPAAPLGRQVRSAVALLRARGALDATDGPLRARPTPPPARGTHPPIAVVVEPRRSQLGCELLGTAAALAEELAASTVALVSAAADVAVLDSWGADHVVHLDGAVVPEDVARGAAHWAEEAQPCVVLAPGTSWGREVAARLAARLGAGLTGDAVEVAVRDGRLVAWKAAFGGQLVAAISATSDVQMVTVRPGVLPLLAPRAPTGASLTLRSVVPRGRVRVLAQGNDDDLDLLGKAPVVIGVGIGVGPHEYPRLDQIRELLGAELAATRKVTDRGWLPRSRQVGITGRSIAPRLYVAVGISGKFNHAVGVRSAGTVLAVNLDADAPIFAAADIGIVGDWRDVLPLLAEELAAATELTPGRA